jgi:hypothetical protein
MARLIHEESFGWTARGLGDPVNASNVSRKKLGDCDFQNLATRKVVAYEAHGGTLTQPYLNEHLRTLPKTAIPRIEEWQTYTLKRGWHVEIIFVAHEFMATPPDAFEILGVPIKIIFSSYQDLVEKTNIHSRKAVLDQYFLRPLSQRKTPEFVRQVLHNVLAENNHIDG